MSRIVLIAAVCGLAIACGPSRSTGIDEQARAIEREVWSPYCPGRLLIDCTTEQARELRTQISDRLEQGESPDEVLEWIRRDHGDEALARPDARGGGLAVWLVPAGIFITGALVVGALIRKWSRASART